MLPTGRRGEVCQPKMAAEIARLAALPIAMLQGAEALAAVLWCWPVPEAWLKPRFEAVRAAISTGRSTALAEAAVVVTQ